VPSLDFKGKQFVYSHHLSVPFRELKIVAKKSLPNKSGPSLDDNLIIHGDNLHALKALLPKYAGKVDVIYIDPPYNTGNEGWAYNDNVNSPLMKEWLGKVVDSEDLERHDKWLCMMWPRLVLLKTLLDENGIFMISIDDNAFSYLSSAIRDIFQEASFIETIIWKRRHNVDSRNLSMISTDHEYLLVVGMGEAKFRGALKDFTKYKNPDNDPRGNWMSDNLTGLATAEERPNLHYDLLNPDTGLKYPPHKERGWRYSRETMGKLIDENKIIWPKKKEGRPRLKRFSSDLSSDYTGFTSIIDGIFTQEGTREQVDIFGTKVFSFPKPSKYIQNLLRQIDNKDALVLDSFAGTGTTAHAVQALNAEDGGSRKFIVIETEDYADSITAERVRRVIKGVPNAKDEKLKNGLGGSFTYCDLGDPIDMEAFFGDAKSMPAYDQLARYIAYTATGEALGKAPTKPADDWFIGEVAGVRLHLIYKPDNAFMRDGKAALNAELAALIKKNNTHEKPTYVFAGVKYIGQKDLTREYGITFCQLPYSIYRIMGDAVGS